MMETEENSTLQGQHKAVDDSRKRSDPRSPSELLQSHITAAIIAASPSFSPILNRKIPGPQETGGPPLPAPLTPQKSCLPSLDTSSCTVERGDVDLSKMSEEMVTSYLNNNPEFVQKWLKSKTNETSCSGSQDNRSISSSNPSTLSANSSCSSLELSTSALSSTCNEGAKTSIATRSASSLHPPKRHTRSSKKHGDPLSEPEMFMELIRDISKELDIDTLCHKILVNVGHLTHADRASLFLAQGPKTNKHLVAKLFDVTVDSDLEEALQNAKEREVLMPWGVGIVGNVASTKQVINIKDAYQDPRFDPSIDERTGYKTVSVLCMPVCSIEGDVIGVAEIINKKNGTREFTSKDVEVFRRYLAFCGIGIQNAQLFDLSMKEYKRNQMLLQLAKGIFTEQTSLDRLVTKIMMDATDILKCERCFVYLLNSQNAAERYRKGSQTAEAMEGFGSLDLQRMRVSSNDSDETNTELVPFSLELENVFTDNRMAEIPSPTRALNHKPKNNWSFHSAFELRCSKGASRIQRHTASEIASSPLSALASYVCDVGRTLNISSVQDWLGTPLEEDGLLSFSILSIPIFDSNKQILGVAQMINKENGLQFSDYDISTFEAFATFCGLGIQNTQVYENACRLMARQKVALECLSYHATASKEDTDSLKQFGIPSAQQFNLFSYDFNDFSLSDMDTCKCVLRMFMELELISKFSINYEVMCRWVLSVKKNYRPVKYHNWRHALIVAQTMFAILKTGKIEKFFTDLEMLGLLVACLSHDLDHRGTNNSFQTKTDSPLAILYTTSTMEHHHFDQCVMILSQDSNNIFQSLSADDYRNVMRVVENAILSTDMGLYFKKKNTFLELSDNGEFDWQSPDKKELLCGMMMTACDVSAIAKPWEIQHKVAKLVADEFFEQGDLEKLKLNQEPIAMMDREKKDELPKMQVGFIDYICLPLYKALSESFPWVKPLYDGCARNKEQWKILAEQVDMGLTWIDHEYIEKPVERNETEVTDRITLQSKSSASVAPSSKQAQLHRPSAVGVLSNAPKIDIRGKMRQSLKMKLGKKNTFNSSKDEEVEKEEVVEIIQTPSPKESIQQPEIVIPRKTRKKRCTVL